MYMHVCSSYMGGRRQLAGINSLPACMPDGLNHVTLHGGRCLYLPGYCMGSILCIIVTVVIVVIIGEDMCPGVHAGVRWQCYRVSQFSLPIIMWLLRIKLRPFGFPGPCPVSHLNGPDMAIKADNTWLWPLYVLSNICGVLLNDKFLLFSLSNILSTVESLCSKHWMSVGVTTKEETGWQWLK